MSKKKFLMFIIFMMALVSYFRTNDALDFNSNLESVGNIIFGSIFYTLYSLFQLIGIFLIAFFVIKAIIYIAINNPSKYIAVIDVGIISFVYGMQNVMTNVVTKYDVYGWKMGYIGIVFYIVRFKFYRKGVGV